ncbi:hypothetical protein AAFF_G00415160 [Aldrovandia affinis]|uniref:Uncharacterized protein n=1 Tax=Aldrovandia affinis TaxID=143900 RepID=A0AAD7SAP3_9TELE|nr:hypothetical protein AAFF_G00415160 [Aldrovandia affinis]
MSALFTFARSGEFLLTGAFLTTLHPNQSSLHRAARGSQLQRRLLFAPCANGSRKRLLTARRSTKSTFIHGFGGGCCSVSRVCHQVKRREVKEPAFCCTKRSGTQYTLGPAPANLPPPKWVTCTCTTQTLAPFGSGGSVTAVAEKRSH